MRGRIATTVAAAALVFTLPAFAQKPSAAPSRPAQGIDIPAARKAVVTIQALDASGQLMASGTGFFVTEGFVVTANHVLEGAAGCRIEMTDGQQQRCSVAAADSVKDVTMLMVSGTPPATLRWGSSEQMKDGDDVTVISNPLGQLPGTVSRGIISASRVVNGTKLLQISAAISHGSSGAPVLNSRGQVVGIVRSTIEAGQSLNFATATDAIRNMNNDQVAVAEGQSLLSPKYVANNASNAGNRMNTSSANIPQVSIGQTINGTLSASDSLYPDTTYFKFYQFMATPGRPMTIDLASSDFDPVLIIRGDDLAQSIINDDGGPGCASRVSQAFAGSGPYRILVNTTSSPHRQTGRFTLTISDGSKPVDGTSNSDCGTGRASGGGGGGNARSASIQTIRIGETINSSLTSSDSLYPDNSYFRFYQFTAPSGPVTLDLSSDDFDPVLIIRGDDLDESIINDDGGPGCNARVSRTFTSGNNYRVLVNTTAHPERQTGSFSLSITQGAKPVQETGNTDCHPPQSGGGGGGGSGNTSSARAIGVGQSQTGMLSRSDVLLDSDSTYAQPWTIQGRAGQTITIDLESDAFDAYLFLRGPGISGGRDFQDDDSGGTCNARLTATFPQSGEYEIVVNTADHYATGSFTLSVTSGSKPKSVARCSRSQ